MRILFVAAVAAILAACSGETADTATSTAKAEAIAQDTRVAAVLIRADWCSSCKIIEPKLTEVKIDGPIEGLQHITMDYTNRDKDAFYEAAEKLGVADAVRDHLEGDVKTGIILLVDMETKSVVADLRKELSEDELKAAMVKSVA
ncbi:MAG: hypothetical protein AAGJ73_02590 [Pseudomonadota bacterium]